MEFQDLEHEERSLETRLLSAPPIIMSLRVRLKAVYYWAVTAALTGAGLALTLFTLAPFRFGRIAWVFAVGVAIVTPFLVENALACQKRLLKALNATAALAALASLMFLADVRANMLDEQLRQNEAQAVVIDGAEPAPQPESNFYSRSNRSLHLAILLLAFAMEAGAAFALREAWLHVPDSSEDWDGMRRRLVAIRGRRTQLARMVVDLRNEPGIFASRFWRDFYRALLSTAVRNVLAKVLLVPLAVAVFSASSIRAQVGQNWVIALDLHGIGFSSQVRMARASSKRTSMEFPACSPRFRRVSRVTVIGITDHSFAQPYILLSARVGADPGYFGRAACRRLRPGRPGLEEAERSPRSALPPHRHPRRDRACEPDLRAGVQRRA